MIAGYRAIRGEVLVLLIALAIILVGSQVACAAGAQLEIVSSPPMTVSPSYGEHQGLVAAMNAAGETKLAWDTSTGEGHSVQAAAISPGGAEAGLVTTMSSGRHPDSQPALALAPAGRMAIAWFEERVTEQVGDGEILSLKIRDQFPGGDWEAARTVWHMAPRSTYTDGGLVVANDDAGDEAVAWLTRREGASSADWTVLVASRVGGGAFTKPAVLATDSSAVPPAIAVNPEGEVTLLWCAPEQQQQLLTTTWHAGASPPASPTVLDAIDGTGPPTLHEGISDLGIKAGGSGSELATWRKGPAADRLESVALRAAWRKAGAAFSPTQTVTSPGVEAREPTVALNAGGGALIAWSEITSDGSGPVLNYATAPADGSLATGSPIVAPLGEHPELQAALLPDGHVLLLWRNENSVFADRWLPGSPVSSPSLVRHVGEEEPVVLAAGGASAPVLAWIGRTPTDSASEAIRYLVAGGLGGFPQAEPVPVIALTGSKKLARQRGVELRVRCAEACVVAATAQLFALKTENAEEAAAAAYRQIGSFLSLRRSLPSQTTKTLKLRLTRKLLRTYCRSARRQDLDAIEVHVAVRLASSVERHFVLGEQPNPGSCPR